MAICSHPLSNRRLLILLCTITTVAYIRGQSLNLFVFENQQSETLLGNIDEGLGFLDVIGSTNRSQLQFKFFSQGNPQTRHFRVDERTGDIYTTQSLDRESLCPDNIKVSCDIDLDVASYSKNFFKIFRVRVTVKDINDNAPEFPEPEIQISVAESVPVNFTVPINGATDKDNGETNTVQIYEIHPINNLFGINVIKNLDGTPEIGILVRERLDREKMASYQLRVLAKDGGSPPRTGTVTVNIAVLDVNDHSPVFSKSLYNATIRENLPVNTPVVRVSAFDEDIGANGQVKYRFSSRTLAKFEDMFSVDSATGEILLKGDLDYEDIKLYRLVVEAFDQASQSQSSQALVVVNLLDINDNSPEMNFNFLSSLENAEISENAKLNDFVAHISVLDKDSGNNSFVNCATDSDIFKIERLYANEFQVILNAKLDREIMSAYEVTVNCRDLGKMSLNNSQIFMVAVLDENDHEPAFLLSSYKIATSEDLGIGEELISVSAIDADIGANGEITYRMFGENSYYFKIHQSTGVITLDESLDFETMPFVTVYVQARDGGSPSLFTSVALDVSVLDINDELPQFNDSSYEFSVIEDAPVGTAVGQVFATDADKFPGGGVVYTIHDTSETRGIFVISERDGEIRTSSIIDREATAVVNLTILAIDSRLSSQNSSVEVSVNILDINDNAPFFMYPSDLNNTVIVSRSHPRNIPVATILTQDLDDGDNGAMFYDILNIDTNNMFSIDHETGDIFLDETFESSAAQETYTLSISVNDHGLPRRKAIGRLYVIVDPTIQSESSEGISNSNMVTVVVVVSITCVISVLILVGICYIRQYHKRPSTQKPNNSNPEVYSGWEGNCSVEILPDGNFSRHRHEHGDGLENPCCTTSDEVSKKIEEESISKMTSQHEDIPWVHSSESIAQKQLDTSSVSPVDIFNLAQSGHMGIWLNYLRQTESSHPRTSSTNSRYTSDSVSNMSSDTLASDSGRGGSEQDSREHDHQIRGCTSPLARCPPNQRLESDYMDMQRSPLSSITAIGKGDNLNLPRIQDKHLLNRGMLLNENLSSICERSETKGDNPYTPMSNCNKQLDFSLKNEELGSTGELHIRDARMFKPHIIINNMPSNKYSSNIATSYNRQGSLTDEDDDATTTSGSYTVDLRDFTEFEEVPHRHRINVLEAEV